MQIFHTLKLSACALLAASSIGLAQDTNAPRTLSPRIFNAPATTPDPVAVPMKTLSGGINVQSLGTVNSEALGVLSGKDGFSSDMWSGVERSLIEALIQTLPNAASSEHLRIMQRRLLLSAAQPPEGKAGPSSLLSLRVSKLSQMGQTRDVISLLRSSPKEERTTELAIIEAESLLLEGETSQACALSARYAQTSQDVFWLKTMAFCRILAKQTDLAMLSLSLLRDSGDQDKIYYDLMDALSAGETGKVENLASPNALNLALIQASQAQLSENILNSDNPNVISVLLKLPQIKMQDRLRLLQKAAQIGIIKTKDLSAGYKKVNFQKDDLEDPIARAEKLSPEMAQALLYQVSVKEAQLAVISSETMAVGLELAQKSNLYLSTAKLYQPIITDMNQTIDLLWFAPHAVRAQLAAGDWENAQTWATLLRNASFSDVEAARAWTKLRPLAAMAGFDVDPKAIDQALRRWWAAQEETPQSFQKAAQLYAMIDGLGLSVPNDLWISLITGPKFSNIQKTNPAVWIKLNKAGLAGRTGETLLMILHGLGMHDLKMADPTFMRDSLFALRMVGLEQNARMLAVEAALNAGL